MRQSFMLPAMHPSLTIRDKIVLFLGGVLLLLVIVVFFGSFLRNLGGAARGLRGVEVPFAETLQTSESSETSSSN